MPTIISSGILVYIVSTSPIVHVQALNRFDDAETCLQTVAEIAKAEERVPEGERINQSLKCLKLSYRSDYDDDGPKQPAAPKSNVGMPQNDHSCKNKITKHVEPCLEAVYVP